MTIHRWIVQIKDGTMDFEQDAENPSGQRNMTEKLNLLLEYQKIPQGKVQYFLNLHFQFFP